MSAIVTVESGPRQVSRQIVVNAAAASLFAMVADPHRHPELDGSGTVRTTPVKGPDRLAKGDKFSVGMKQYGVPYKITSKVTAFQDGRLIEWQHPAGHRWRWEFSELAPGKTQVTETFDYRKAKVPAALDLLKVPAKNAKGITKTLEALAARYS